MTAKKITNKHPFLVFDISALGLGDAREKALGQQVNEELGMMKKHPLL